MIYLGGSLANKRIPIVADQLRAAGFDIFDQWYAAGEGADEKWLAYARIRGLGYKEALALDFVQTAFDFDMKYLREAEKFVLVAPAGKSGFLELGLCSGWNKPTYVLFEGGEPERPDLMTK